MGNNENEINTTIEMESNIKKEFESNIKKNFFAKCIIPSRILTLEREIDARLFRTTILCADT